MLFRHRDLPSLLLVLLLFFLVVLTLSQILVIHHVGRFGSNQKVTQPVSPLGEVISPVSHQVSHQVSPQEPPPSGDGSQGQATGQTQGQHKVALPPPRSPNDVYRVASMAASVKNKDLSSVLSKLKHKVPSMATAKLMWQQEMDVARIGDIIRSAQHRSRSRRKSLTANSKMDVLNGGNNVTSGGAGANLNNSNVLDRNSSNNNNNNNNKNNDSSSSSNLTLWRNTTSDEDELSDDESSVATRPVAVYCPPVPPHLHGRMPLSLPVTKTMAEVSLVNREVMSGGRWMPSDCIARHRVALIIPYRDRLQHLTTLLYHLHPILQRQQLDYTIFVIEQLGNLTFNKARLMNVAFLESLRQYSFRCVVFHDVDLIPEDDRNMYSCPSMPRHMSVAIDEMNYKLQYPELVGGVLAMKIEHFQQVNGYSNMYWGWGAEDDDMAYRIQHAGLKITRPPIAVARYSMIRHTKRKPSDWKKRYKLLYTGLRRQRLDGLNSVRYRLVFIKKMSLYTHVMIDIGKPPPGF